MREQDIPRDVYDLLSSSTKKEIRQLSTPANYVLSLSRQALYDIQECTKSAEENRLIAQAKQEETTAGGEPFNEDFKSSYKDFRQQQDKRAAEAELKKIEDKKLKENRKKSLLLKQIKENRLEKKAESIITRSVFGTNGVWTKPQSNINNALTQGGPRSTLSGSNCKK